MEKFKVGDLAYVFKGPYKVGEIGKIENITSNFVWLKFDSSEPNGFYEEELIKIG